MSDPTNRTDPRSEYWRECISQALDECGLSARPDQIDALTDAVAGAHENIGQAFYSPPSSDPLDAMKREWQAKIDRLQGEFDAYRRNAEVAAKRALKQFPDARVSIHESGEVLRHGGRTERIQ